MFRSIFLILNYLYLIMASTKIKNYEEKKKWAFRPNRNRNFRFKESGKSDSHLIHWTVFKCFMRNKV